MCDTTATVSEPVSPTKPNRRAIRRRHLLELILSLLTPQQIRRLRVRYAKGRETIAELSRLSHCPPVLLYCVLTPLWSQTPVKLRLLRVEKQVTLLLHHGMTETRITGRRCPGTRVAAVLRTGRRRKSVVFVTSPKAERPEPDRIRRIDAPAGEPGDARRQNRTLPDLWPSRFAALSCVSRSGGYGDPRDSPRHEIGGTVHAPRQRSVPRSPTGPGDRIAEE